MSRRRRLLCLLLGLTHLLSAAMAVPPDGDGDESGEEMGSSNETTEAAGMFDLTKFDKT
jgi:hypothetical protein